MLSSVILSATVVHLGRLHKLQKDGFNRDFGPFEAS